MPPKKRRVESGSDDDSDKSTPEDDSEKIGQKSPPAVPRGLLIKRGDVVNRSKFVI